MHIRLHQEYLDHANNNVYEKQNISGYIAFIFKIELWLRLFWVCCFSRLLEKVNNLIY